MAVRHFRHHLIGTRFRVRTDHRPLQFRSVVKYPWGRRARWIAELEEYSFSMEYIEGHQNKVADALSRLGFQQDRCEDGVDCEEVARTGSSGTTNPTVLSVSQMCYVLVGDIWSEDKFRAAQMDDTLLGEVYGLLRDNPMSALTISSDMKRLLDENLYISL